MWFPRRRTDPDHPRIRHAMGVDPREPLAVYRLPSAEPRVVPDLDPGGLLAAAGIRAQSLEEYRKRYEEPPSPYAEAFDRRRPQTTTPLTRTVRGWERECRLGMQAAAALRSWREQHG